MEAAILVQDLQKAYEGREAVRGISFTVGVGEVFGFLGPNGAGKTTSIRMMIGELQRDAGRIEILSLPMPDRREEIKGLIGVVPDHQNLYDRLTVRQNLDLFARLYGVSSDRVTETIRLVNLDEHADLATQKLSRGLRQRTLIARGLLHRPRVFFLDEPTSALDPHSALVIRDLIRALQKEGTTVLLTTHYMEEAASLCNRIAILHQGRLVACDTPDSLRRKHGRPIIRVTLNGPSGAEEIREIPLHDKAGAEALAGLLTSGQVAKVHSQEATLEEVFMNLTGATWKDPENGEVSPPAHPQ